MFKEGKRAANTLKYKPICSDKCLEAIKYKDELGRGINPGHDSNYNDKDKKVYEYEKRA